MADVTGGPGHQSVLGKNSTGSSDHLTQMIEVVPIDCHAFLRPRHVFLLTHSSRPLDRVAPYGSPPGLSLRTTRCHPPKICPTPRAPVTLRSQGRGFDPATCDVVHLLKASGQP